MAGETSKKSGAVHSILRKLWFWVVVGLAALFVIILVSMPIGINRSLRELIRQNGGDEAYIEDINFNPFNGKLELTGLSVKVENDHVLQISHALLDVIYIPFFKKQIQVQTLAVSGLDILIESLPEGRWRDRATPWAADADASRASARSWSPVAYQCRRARRWP